MVTSAKSSPTGLLAACCLLSTLFLLAATIVLALIPIYLPEPNITIDTTRGYLLLSAGYASNTAGGRSLQLAETGSLAPQLARGAGIATTDLGIAGAGFVAASAASKKKRQTIGSNAIVTCERATGLFGDIFVSNYQIQYPRLCLTSICRRRYLSSVQTALRMNYQPITVVMNFTGIGLRTVDLKFCGFFSSDSTSCTTETKSYAYLMDMNHVLYQFNPSTFNITALGTMSCSTSGTPYSIAVQRNGLIWTSFTDGSLFTYNVKSGQCISTAFSSNQSNFNLFGLTFVKSTSDSSETLYAAQTSGDANTLGIIDLSTLTLSVVNNFTNSSTFIDATLAGTNDGRLFGIFPPSPYIVSQISKSNANILSEYTLNVTTASNNTYYAFAAYNSTFLFFNGDGNYTDVYVFDPSTNTTTLEDIMSESIIAATTSSCLGTA